MGSALGFIEMPNLTDAVEALDVMLKTATVEFVTWEKKLGGRLVTTIVRGEVSAIKAAVDAAKHSGAGKIVASAVIANPHSETEKMVAISAARFR